MWTLNLFQPLKVSARMCNAYVFVLRGSSCPKIIYATWLCVLHPNARQNNVRLLLVVIINIPTINIVNIIADFTFERILSLARLACCTV